MLCGVRSALCSVLCVLSLCSWEHACEFHYFQWKHGRVAGRSSQNKMGRSRFPGKPHKFHNRKRISVLLDTVIDDNEFTSVTGGSNVSVTCFSETFVGESVVSLLASLATVFLLHSYLFISFVIV